MATEKQKTLVKKISENIRNKPFKQLALESGYKESVANSPHQIKKGKGYKDVYDQYFSDKKVVRVHNKLLTAQKFQLFSFPVEMSDEDIKDFLKGIGHDIRIRLVTKTSKDGFTWMERVAIFKTDNLDKMRDAVDMAYKIKGKYKETIVDEKVNPYENLSDEELLQKLEEARKNDRYSKFENEGKHD